MNDSMAESNLIKLNKGLLLRFLRQEIAEPQNYVLDMQSNELLFLSRQNQYGSEMARVLNELKMTVHLMQKLHTDAIPIEHPYNKEDQFKYYQGVFLHLTHQMKEKVLNLVQLITNDAPPSRLNPEEKVKIKKLLINKEEKLTSIGILDLLRVWGDDTNTEIGIALKKRTAYHHSIGTLHLNTDLQDFKLSKIMLISPTLERLTPEGIAYFEELGIRSLSKWITDGIKKAEDTLKKIEDNIEYLANRLIEYYKMTVSDEEYAKIIAEKQKLDEDLKIKNETSGSKIPSEISEIIRLAIDEIVEWYKDEIEVIYLLGSSVRGEYLENLSDINFCIVLKTPQALSKSPPNLSYIVPNFDMKIYYKDDFLGNNPKAMKARFICHSDGVVVYGNDVIGKGKFPKPGLDLALMLNSDLDEDIARFEDWMEKNPSASASEIGIKSKEIAKRSINMIYGIAITNRPSYTSSREKRIDIVNAGFPENTKAMLTYQGILSSLGVGTLEGLGYLIDNLKNLSKKMNEMQEIQKKVNEKSLKNSKPNKAHDINNLETK